MKLIFRKDKEQNIEILIRNGVAEDKFSYVEMIKSLLKKNKFEECEFEEGITDFEKESINKMLTSINKSILENKKVDS
ncbi:MAG: hypothetical protein WA057_03490 [Candidatus Magasanikiibacteriota bacterium]